MSADEYTNDLPARQYTKCNLFNGTRWVLAYAPSLLDATVQLNSDGQGADRRPEAQLSCG